MGGIITLEKNSSKFCSMDIKQAESRDTVDSLTGRQLHRSGRVHSDEQIRQAHSTSTYAGSTIRIGQSASGGDTRSALNNERSLRSSSASIDLLNSFPTVSYEKPHISRRGSTASGLITGELDQDLLACISNVYLANRRESIQSSISGIDEADNLPARQAASCQSRSLFKSDQMISEDEDDSLQNSKSHYSHVLSDSISNDLSKATSITDSMCLQYMESLPRRRSSIRSTNSVFNKSSSHNTLTSTVNGSSIALPRLRGTSRMSCVKSNDRIVRERNQDPTLRQRPTSAGVQDSINNACDEDVTRALSDTEIDAMEINLS